MAFPLKPSYSTDQINRAGDVLIAESPPKAALTNAREILKNWRAAHNYPMNTFQSTLRSKTRGYRDAIVAQRLKRMPTIEAKLRRKPVLKLSELQDIGGLRAVVANMNDLQDLHSHYRQIKFTHELIRTDDYVARPKRDGYRSIHLIYRYKLSRDPGQKWNGLQIELQLRTRLQHSWATAVETMGTVFGEQFKLGATGRPEWRDFFLIVSSAFAHLEESVTTRAHRNMSEAEIFAAVAKAEADLKALDSMNNLAIAMQAIERSPSSSNYYLIILKAELKDIEIYAFPESKLKEANEELAKAEARAASGEKIDPVLVSTGGIANLRAAYPNYFLDVGEFASHVRDVIGRAKSLAKSR